MAAALQHPLRRYDRRLGLRSLMDRIVKGEIDSSFVIAHRANLDQRPELYTTFRDKRMAESKSS
jgi:threonine dehydrogenase-like Zn-dependent dehydrogenase